MRIILDTGVLFRPSTIDHAFNDGRPVVVPTLVIAERTRQMNRDGRDATRMLSALKDAGATFEAFDLQQCGRLPHKAHDKKLWQRHARDALIAAHIGPGDELWTTNARDFETLGVPRERIRAC